MSGTREKGPGGNPGDAGARRQSGVKLAHLILTVDYELFGDGSGCVERCVLDPAERMLAVAERHGARLTFFVEALEFAAMEAAGGQPARDAVRVREQLLHAARGGHDLQLHLHPQWLGAHHDAVSGWSVDRARWRLGSLPEEDLRACLEAGLAWLRLLRRDAGLDPAPTVFRAGGWCIQPSAGTLNLLRTYNFRVESSVAPGLRESGGVWYDFRAAPGELAAWPIGNDVCMPVDVGELIELPIATGFVGWSRRLLGEARRRLMGGGSLAPNCRGSYAGPDEDTAVTRRTLAKVRRAGTAMLDLCALSAPLLTRLAERWIRDRRVSRGAVPVAAIGHTKNFCRRAEGATGEFLARLAADGRFFFSDYGLWLGTHHGSVE